jgi:hypothetical protein
MKLFTFYTLAIGGMIGHFNPFFGHGIEETN